MMLKQVEKLASLLVYWMGMLDINGIFVYHLVTNLIYEKFDLSSVSMEFFPGFCTTYKDKNRRSDYSYWHF
ncbi:hypothetical protein SPHINGO8BC_50903 [Sphingobacterium multivorum]|uniref:Uncharacterized protein n=1 Tax=Sphingobacterium multivorum TaxID=28454 RepID=A0A654CGM4_SPHMU|nr:hypothetical protein SPHINGO8BC_50903 [Sphingobacterium multivorum]